MLEYENQLFLDVLHQDGLVVAAKGLGLESIILSLIKVYSDPGNLVIVLGTTGKEEEFYISQLQCEKVKTLPKVITTEYSSSDREIVYLEGGVLFVSPRILVVDLLKDRVPVEHITGFIVCRAHSILESCQEAFALRLYRQKNKTGFIKAFSNSAQSFTVGFAHVERIMKTLFVKNLYLWPRFHATVQSSLQKIKPAVMELHLDLTPPMLQIQTALLDLMNFVVKELKRCNPTLDMDELTVENALSKSFSKIVKLQLDPIWHQLSTNTKQLIADLRTLSHLLRSLTRYDCITFYNQLNALRTTEYIHKNSGWMVLSSAETLFVVAKQRMLGKSRLDAKVTDVIDVDPETNPKWVIISEILKEINTAVKIKKEDNSMPERVLILVEDNRICEQLKQYLTMGAEDMLLSFYKRTFRLRQTPTLSRVKEEVKGDEGAAAADDAAVELQDKDEDADEDFKDCYTLSQRPASEDTSGGSDIKMEVMDVDVTELEKSLAENFEAPIIVIQTFKKQGDPLTLLKTLKELQPKYVIMYDVDMTTIRRLEVFQAEHPEIPLHVYFMIYGGSVEEQAYLTTLRKEKEAFEYLIKEKATMVILEDQDGRSGDCAELSRDSSKPNAVANTRKGGGQENSNSVTPVIIVDMREFRSELPALIHKRGIEIEPVTLQVGDYILTPEICVERKSISDLIGSLNSGRLYNQALAMTRYYAKPMLLIEFDQNKPFALQGHYYVSNDMSSHNVVAKLQLLTLHFPKLRLVWSPSPYATAQLFEELKQGRLQPSASQAATVGAELESELDDIEKYNSAIHDFVLKLPGITSKNIRSVLNKGQSLDHLIGLSKAQLGELVNNSAEAQSLYSALHDTHRPTDDTSFLTKSWKGKGKSRFFKKRKT